MWRILVTCQLGSIPEPTVAYNCFQSYPTALWLNVSGLGSKTGLDSFPIPIKLIKSFHNFLRMNSHWKLYLWYDTFVYQQYSQTSLDLNLCLFFKNLPCILLSVLYLENSVTFVLKFSRDLVHDYPCEMAPDL